MKKEDDEWIRLRKVLWHPDLFCSVLDTGKSQMELNNWAVMYKMDLWSKNDRTCFGWWYDPCRVKANISSVQRDFTLLQHSHHTVKIRIMVDYQFLIKEKKLGENKKNTKTPFLDSICLKAPKYTIKESVCMDSFKTQVFLFPMWSLQSPWNCQRANMGIVVFMICEGAKRGSQ